MFGRPVPTEAQKPLTLEVLTMWPSSEATSIYDARNSIFRAYATLFRQWDLVFAIGAANRKLGHRPAALALLREEWKKYQELSACYPMAD